MSLRIGDPHHHPRHELVRISFFDVSVNLVRAIDEARRVGAKVFGIVGKDGGYTKKSADECVVIPVVSNDRITPHTEGFCAVVWHLLVSHPALKVTQTKWESVR